jgi:hypothetical protein
LIGIYPLHSILLGKYPINSILHGLLHGVDPINGINYIHDIYPIHGIDWYITVRYEPLKALPHYLNSVTIQIPQFINHKENIVPFNLELCMEFTLACLSLFKYFFTLIFVINQFKR